ncbi:MAG: hypothetical protein ABEI77_04450 [Halorientalis sp.]
MHDDPINNPDIGGAGAGIDDNVHVEDINVSVDDIGADIDVSFGNENQTATPSNPKATKHIAAAREKLNDAFNKYTDQTPGRKDVLTGITPSTKSFVWVHIRTDVKAAFTELEKGAKHATKGQATNIVALEHVGYFLLLSAKVDGKLTDAYKHFDFAVERLFNESLVQAELARKKMNDDTEKARQMFKTMRHKIKPRGMGVLAQMSERQYERKVRQLDNDIAAFQQLKSGLSGTQSGLAQLGPGVDAYLSDDFKEARKRFTRASAHFGISTTSYSLVPHSTGLDTRAQDINATVKTMEQATEDLRRSAQGKLDDKRLVYYEARRSAEEHIKSDKRVKNISSFHDIVY